METSVDNTNNTANITTNNTIDLFDVFQKPVAIPEFKSNGTTDNNETDLYFFDKPTNGKRPADFDEEDEDFGPETDVDTVDDVLLSPTIAAAKALVEGNVIKNFDDQVDKMDIIDVDMELQRQQSSDFEPGRGCREETPTPPADSVLDSSGLADNVAESGEDSEDEWNYYRVDPKQKENNENSLETNTKVSTENPFDIESDEMSQLNPDAKEFVPVSPTRNNAISPVPNFNRDVTDDTLVARSPRRAMPMANYVPSPEEFCRDLKQRPSELFEELEKDIENNQNQNGHQLSHQEIMQNLLNGKDPSEIEFHPSNYNNLICKENDDNKENEEKLETPMQPDTTNANANADAAVDAGDFSTFIPRSQDPMSMSFYQDKNEEGTEFSTNPFDDLNKVQVLPDYIDDMPQSNQSTDAEVHLEDKSPVNTPTQNDVCELPKSPELQHETEAEEAETKLKLEAEHEQEDDVCSLPKSPIDVSSSPVHNDNVCELPQSPSLETCEPPKSPLLNDACEIPKSPLQNDVCEIPKSPLENDACELPKSPLQNDVCEIPKSPIHIDVCEISKSPMLDVHSPMELSSPVGPLSPKSPIPELTGLVSPDITASIKDENVSAEISETTKSPMINQTPIEDEVEQQAKSPLMEENAVAVATPEIADNEIKSPLPIDDFNPVEDIVAEASNAIVDDAAAATKIEEIMCELNQETSDVQELITDAIQDITSDVNKTNQEQCLENTELSVEPKYLAEHITDIANEINEIIADNNINNVNSNLEDKFNLVENSNNLIECTTATATATAEPLNDFIQETEAKSPELNNTSIVESEVAPSDIMNSFLDRSVIPEVTSPLSPPEKFEQDRPELWKCEYPLPSQHDIKCETIQPEFPVHTIASPSEESKGNDTPPPTPANVTEEPELKLGSPEPQKIVEAVEKLGEPPVENKESAPAVAAVVAAAAVVAGTATAAAVSKTAKIKSGSSTTTAAAATKKLSSKTSPTSPSKTLASKPSTTARRTTTTAAPKITTITTAKLAPAKPKTTTTVTTTPTPSPKPIGRTAPPPKPKTPTTTALKSAADKKPLTNGDAKAPIRQPLLKKSATSTVGAKPTTTTTTTTATSKVSLTKTSSATSRPLANGTAKPALSATKTTARPSLTSSAAPKPRPSSLTSKSTTTTLAAKAAPIKLASTTATKSLGTTATKPKPTASAAPRPRMVLTAKTTVKTADTEKQIKETANKQISASRTSATRTSSTTTRTSTTATQKKAAPLTNRTSTTTRTTTVKSSATGKKPTEVTRTTVTKTKSSPVKPNVEQNGVVNVIQEITTVSVVSEHDDSQLQLVKDNSPVDAIPPIVDNSQLPPPPMEIIAD